MDLSQSAGTNRCCSLRSEAEITTRGHRVGTHLSPLFAFEHIVELTHCFILSIDAEPRFDRTMRTTANARQMAHFAQISPLIGIADSHGCGCRRRVSPNVYSLLLSDTGSELVRGLACLELLGAVRRRFCLD